MVLLPILSINFFDRREPSLGLIARWMTPVLVPIVMLFGFGCSPNSPQRPAQGLDSSTNLRADVDPSQARVLTTLYLPNVVQVHERVLSGGLPKGEAAFAELQELGIKTIISVDGATPEVELAKQFGLRYVHLPHGYDGISQQRAQELIKAVRELDGPIYIHCHHGKHRSPAAATVACVGAGLIEANAGARILQLAGTNPNYRGLFAAVDNATPLDVSVTQRLDVAFPEIAQLPPMAEVMVDMDKWFEVLHDFQLQNWPETLKGSDTSSAQAALMLKEHYAELLREDNPEEAEEGFQEFLRSGLASLDDLEQQLTARPTQINSKSDLEVERTAARLQWSERLDQVAANCKNCHQRYRDQPASSLSSLAFLSNPQPRSPGFSSTRQLR